MQVSMEEICSTCNSGKLKYMCPNCPTGTSLCPHDVYYMDCPTCNGLGKVVNRGKTCKIHGRRKGRCPDCQLAEKLTGVQHFFGKREREAAAKAAADGAA